MGQEAAWIRAHVGPEATCLPAYPQDSRPLSEAQRPSGGTGRQEARPIAASTPLPPLVYPPGSRPTREATPSGCHEGQPDALYAVVLPPGGELEANLDHDWREATADGPLEVPELRRVVQRTLTQSRRDPTLPMERDLREAYGGTPRGPLGLEVGKDRGRGGQERPEEEDYCSRRPAPDQQEDALEANGQTIPDRAGHEAVWIQANARPKATCPP